MLKVYQLICLIVSLMLLATSCMARTATSDDCTRCRSTYLPPCYRDTCDAYVCADVCRTAGDDCTRCRSTYLPPCYRDNCDARVCADVCGGSE